MPLQLVRRSTIARGVAGPGHPGATRPQRRNGAPRRRASRLSGLKFGFEELESRNLLTAVAVSIPDDLRGTPGGHVIVPVNISSVDGVRAAEIHLKYDTSLLDAANNGVVRNANWPDNTTMDTTVNESSGTISISLNSSQAMASGATNLVTIDFTIKSGATVGTSTTLDLESVQVNQGDISVTPAPQAGSDASDGTILITVNHAPLGVSKSLTIQEDAAYTFTQADFGFTDPNDSPADAFSAVKITTLPAQGSLKNNGIAVTAGQSVSVADVSAGKLIYTPAANGNGSPYASFTFQVQDDAGTAGGGADLDPTPKTMTLNVTAVNDRPVVGGLTDSPDPVNVGQTVTLTATGVADSSDSTGSVVSVAFYRESNGTAGLQTGAGGDTLLGSDTNGGDGWSFSASTAGLTAGTYTYYAQATDNEGATSDPASTTNVVQGQAQYQIVTDTATTMTAKPGESISIPVRYTTSTGDNTLTGLGLRMHYNSSVLTYSGLTSVLATPTQQQAPVDDTSNLDNDASTDKYVLVSWADIGGNWPGQTLPTQLYAANFIVASGASLGTQSAIRFSASSTASGYSLQSQAVTVKVATPVTVTINQASSQLDPAKKSPVRFTAVFSSAVTGFTDLSDVSLSGTATTKQVKSITPVGTDGKTYEIQVTVNGAGTVIATIPAGVAQDSIGTLNQASTSTDNSVTSSVAIKAASPGLYDSSKLTFHLRYSATSGSDDLSFAWGLSGPVWQPVAGDWDGDGYAGIGLYCPTTSYLYLDSSYRDGKQETALAYGQPAGGWQAVIGDWDGDGIDTIGLYDPVKSLFYLRNSNTTGYADTYVYFGQPSLASASRWLPIAGDWNGDGKDTVGLYDPVHSVFYLRNSNTSGLADVTFTYSVSGSSWVPIAGDWDSNGTDGVGLYNASTSVFHITNTVGTGYTDTSFTFGSAGQSWTPIAGAWNASLGSSLHAAGVLASPEASLPPSPRDLAEIRSAALARWQAAGLGPAALELLENVRFETADLAGTEIGRAVGKTIYLDRDAAGHGWFIDPTPGDDAEFQARSGRATDASAVDRLDLLTVVEHELGHIAGLDDSSDAGDALMSGVLPTGVRRAPSPQEIDLVMQGIGLH